MEYTRPRSLFILFSRSDYGSEFEVASAGKSVSARIVPWMQSFSPAVTFPLSQIIKMDQTRQKDIKGQWVAITKETILIFKVLIRK